MVERHELSRRDVLKLAGGAGAVGLAGAYGLGAFDRAPDAPTTAMSDEESRELAERFAPVYYFDRYEKWFPTDPRPYESESDGETVVDGFDAFDGYTERFRERGEAPDPTVFYRTLRYEDSALAAVQFWWYAAFDQFSVNFHWHDWELTQVFVDLETGDPNLFVGSAHSRRVPNNEFLEPERTSVPRILAELGSHSGGLSVNDIHDRFNRLPLGDTIADITNSVLEGLDVELPAAYGLPRDEGFRLPYVIPELDGALIHEHERLPSVDRAALVAPELTVHSFSGLASPPEDLPQRETGRVFAFDRSDVDADVSYALVPTAELEHISAFTGPQLSFEFDVPEFGEDLVAGHITSTGVPWEQPRYDDPASDVTDPAHRQALADRYEAIADPAPVNRLVAAVRQTEPDDDAPDGEGVETTDTSVESVCLVESDPSGVPTFNGVAVVDDLPAGEHRFTVNGAGLAPHSERVTVTNDGGPDFAGVDGAVVLSPNEDAVKLEVDADGVDDDLERLAVEDDFAGRLYDAPMDGPDAVYVHREGAYTTEVRDTDDAVGAFRVNPGSESHVRLDRPRTGKASLASFLAAISAETRTGVQARVDVDLDTDVGGATGASGTETDDGGGGSNDLAGVTGLLRALDAVLSAAERAAERADAGDRPGADRSLETVSTRLGVVADRLEGARGDLPDPMARAVENRLAQARHRTDQALESEKL